MLSSNNLITFVYRISINTKIIILKQIKTIHYEETNTAFTFSYAF